MTIIFQEPESLQKIGNSLLIKLQSYVICVDSVIITALAKHTFVSTGTSQGFKELDVPFCIFREGNGWCLIVYFIVQPGC